MAKKNAIIKVKLLFIFGHNPNYLPPAIEMIAALQRDDHQVDVLYMDTEDTYHAHNAVRVPTPQKLEKLFVGFNMAKKVKRLHANNHYNALVGVDIIGLETLNYCKKVADVKRVFWAFEIFSNKHMSKLRPDFWRIKSMHKYLKAIDVVFAPSKTRLDHFPTPEAVKKEVIINCTQFVAKDIQKPKDVVNIVYSGRISDSQNVSEIVAALAHLPKHYVLHLAGIVNELYLKMLLDEAGRLGMKDRLKYYGALNLAQLKELLKHMHIGVAFYKYAINGSSSDPTPNKIGDYIANEIFVVGSAQSYMQYWLDEVGLGKTVSNITTENISTAIEEVATYSNDSNKVALIKKVYTEIYNIDKQEELFVATINE